VGHAIQFDRQESVSKLRSRYLPTAFQLKKIGVLLLTATPFVAIIIRAPAAIMLFVGIGLFLQLLGAMAYLVILPEEWDASFKKAMPILTEGEYIDENDIPAVQSVLKAAAYTYFAAALADLLNIGRWIMVLNPTGGQQITLIVAHNLSNFAFNAERNTQLTPLRQADLTKSL